MKLETYSDRENGNMTVNLLECDRNRILVVDDQKTVRDVFRLVISYELPECHVDVVENGAEAVELFRKDHDGILLMDLNMPVMDGQAAFYEIERICNEEKRRMPSVLFCTGYQPPNGLNRLIEGNSSHGLLLKPVSGNKLVSEIRKRMAA
jgi:CheY-like chemotaxis protein